LTEIRKQEKQEKQEIEKTAGKKLSAKQQNSKTAKKKQP